MKLKPLHDWAVIVPAEAESRTAGGLYIPDSAKEKPEEGVVEAIGPGAYEEEKQDRKKKKEEKKERKFIPATVKPGDRVLYERYAGQTYTVDNEERILVRERDILGLIDRPLQIPAVTTSRATTMIMERPAPSPPMKVQQKKASAKTVKKKAEKTAAKAPVKKAVKKKTVGKTVKKAAAKSLKRAAKPAKARPSKVKKARKKK